MNWPHRPLLAAAWQRLTLLADADRWRAMLTQDVGLKLISLVVAFGLWAFVNASERDTEQAVQVPLELRNIPAALMVTSPRIDFVDLRLSGPRTLLSRIDRKRLAVPLDLTGVRPGPAAFRLSADTLNLPRGVVLVRMTPSQITLDLARIRRRSVPVRLQFVGKLPPGLRLLETQISPDSIEVIGPSSVVEEVKAVETEAVDVTGATSSTIERELLLPAISEYLTFSAQRVAAHVVIGEVDVDREFRDLPVAVRNTTLRSTVEPAVLRMKVRGPKSVVESLELGRGQVYVDATDAAVGRHSRKPIVDLPPRVEILQQEPAMVRMRLQR